MTGKNTRRVSTQQSWKRTLRVVFPVLVVVALADFMANTQTSTPPSYEVKLEHVWIPMKDGVRLAADLYMPVGGKPGEKFPAIFKYDPYRKDDNEDIIEECALAKYFVARGYVSACVDIRGTGQSEGHTPNREYSEQELSDGEEIIAWLASQGWSSGAVGIFGASWSGFNGLQLAMRHPPALKAIISAVSTERIYDEDCHYYFGMMNSGDSYNFGIDSENPRSPSPNFLTDEKTLQNRFDNPPWTLLWLRHQRDDAFWHEPERPLDSIRIPIFLTGGFVDGYRDTIPRLLRELKSPVKAIMGPWEHAFPHEAGVGPDIEWRELAVRWLDQWLKGRDTGVSSEPKLAVYMRHSYPPDPTLMEIPGEWRSEKSWPPQDQKIQSLYLKDNHSLDAESTSTPAVHSLKYVPSIGIDVGLEAFDLQPDQRPVDAFSLVYDSAPVKADGAILGMPEVHLQASATAPLANWFARLSDVAPDGSVTLITFGGLNGTQRESMADPRDLEPNRTYTLRVSMRFTSWVFTAGHRIRLSISNAQWPMFWPTPYAMTTSLYLGGDEPSRLLLPTVPTTGPLPPPHFGPVAQSDWPSSPQSASPNTPAWTLHRSEFGTPVTIESGRREGWSRPQKWPWGTYYGRGFRKFEVQDDHPELASYVGNNDFRVQLPNRELIWHTEWDLHSDRTNFYYLLKRELRENGKVIREKEWKETIPRDHQ
jgi:predicted acyl esterase